MTLTVKFLVGVNFMNIKVSGMPDMNEDMPVLTFIVRDSKDFTARELQSALIKFFIEHYSFLKAQELFTEWNNGRFRKILKRVKPNDFNKIVKQVSGRSYSSGNINLFVLPLHRKFDEPIGIKRAQVTGLTVLDETIQSSSEEDLLPDGSFVQFFVNSNIDMTVSKQTIALCHAVHQFFEETSSEIIEKWASNNYAFTINEIIIENNEKFDTVIHDAGLTEVTPGSITAAATCNVK